MKTSKEMQIAVLEKMLSNIKGDEYVFDGIQFYNFSFDRWDEIRELSYRVFKSRTLRIKE